MDIIVNQKMETGTVSHIVNSKDIYISFKLKYNNPLTVAVYIRIIEPTHNEKGKKTTGYYLESIKLDME